MKKKWLWALIPVLVLVTVGFCGCSSAPANVQLNSQQTGIWVTGTGDVTVTPDISTLRLGVSSQAVTVDEAQSQAIEAMNKVMQALEDSGVDKKDIQTQYYNISQVTEWDQIKNENKVVGYQVTNTVTAKVRDVDKTGTIIDDVVRAGGDLTRIDSISFSVDDPSIYYEEAREKAMADAKERAENLAKLGGVNLGKPIYISESTVTPYPIYKSITVEAGMAVPAPAPTPISAGEQEVTINVQVVYDIS
jgi:uncharacterized protein YggE